MASVIVEVASLDDPRDDGRVRRGACDPPGKVLLDFIGFHAVQPDFVPVAMRDDKDMINPRYEFH